MHNSGKYTFDVDPERESGSTVGIESLVLNNIVAALEMFGQPEIEQHQHLASCRKLVMPAPGGKSFSKCTST